MRALLQRVRRAEVRVSGARAAAIGPGLLVLLGVAVNDESSDAVYVARKISNLRLFGDDGGFQNSVKEVGGEVLVVSQFTLYGSIKKGRRPSFTQAAPAVKAGKLYQQVIRELTAAGLRVEQGVFQEHMQVELVNDGPVTIMVESPGQARIVN